MHMFRYKQKIQILMKLLNMNRIPIYNDDKYQKVSLNTHRTCAINIF